MTTTRERLDRRWTALRVILLSIGVLAAAGILAGLALWLLPPILAETPQARLNTAQRIAVDTPAGGSADPAADGSATDTAPDGPSSAVEEGPSVVLSAGWAVLGVGPFERPETLTAISPDDLYRAEFGTLPTSEGTVDDADLETLLAAHDLGDHSPTSGWSTETLRSGLVAHYADFAPAGDTDAARPDSPAGSGTTDAPFTITVAVVTSPDPSVERAVALVAVVDSPATPGTHRSVTATLLESVLIPAPTSPGGPR